MNKLLKIKLIGIVVLSFLAIALFIPRPASAASFDAGRIIDDSVFTNKSSMSVGDIQNFLNSKVPTCDTYHAPGPSSQGSNPPWTCLKNYNEGGKSAAQIIWEQAQNYSINPQVLLVTLQKENGLITDDWPYPWQYRTAMGFGCPDGAPCDAQWFGFTNQVSQAARHFRNFYDQNPAWYIPYRTGSNFIKWNPNSACGGTNVNIQNRATAALYSYTPYQPNSAALNNLYGSGDGCSAYGNRNFWRDFNNWFGSTISAPYNWEYVGQSASGNLVAGQKTTWTLSARNTGTATWTRSGANPVRLGTDRTRDRYSSFCTASWVNCARPAQLNEASVPPGSIGTFTFEVQAPASPGNYNEYFNLVAEGNSWMNELGMFFNPSVAAGNLSSSVVSNNMPATIAAGGTANVTIVMKNTGNTYWYNSGKYSVNLGASAPQGRSSQFSTSTWLGADRPAKMTESVVAPGQNATFSFPIKAPLAANIYSESFSLVAEGWSWFGQSVTNSVNVGGATPPPTPPTPPASTSPNYLAPNQGLSLNSSIVSPNGQYRLIMQGDGNLVLYSPNRAIWWTGTQNTGASLFVIQGDGNMVIYSPSRAVWASYTQNRGAKTLFLQDDGNLVLYDASFRPIWNSNTAGRV
jgi:hypothetical protein